MANTGSVQRYKLTGNESINVTKMGSTSVLEIGQYQFELPADQQGLTRFANNWQQVSSDIQNLHQGGTGFTKG